MKKLALLFILLTMPAFAQKLEIAATVNDDIITSRDVEGRINMALQGANLPDDDAIRRQLRKQALDSLIDEQIRMQEADRLGIVITPEELDESFAKLSGQNGLSAEEFKNALSRFPGVYPSLRRQLKSQIAWAGIVRKKIRPQITITENDISEYLAEREKNPARVEYQLAEIFLKNTEANQKIAQQIITEIDGGRRFSALAKQFSQGLEAGKGGSLGWVTEGRFEPEIDAALAATPVGKLSPVITTQRGLHIIFVRDKRDILPAKEGSQRLHLKQAVVPLPKDVPADMMKRAEEQAKFFQSEARDCAAMDEVIKKINHPMSRDIGSVRLADMPPEVAQKVKDAPIGQASDPIRAGDGLIVLMVCERSEGGDEAMREDVANALGIERLNRLQYRYYRDLRAAAYVDFRN
jgi:peptidyl-prolyl cis-trans isomerase SurA